MQNWLIDTIGWLGAVAVLYAYIMVSTNRLKGDSVHYQVFNILGALFLIINTAYNGAYPSTVVNIIWIMVALYSLSRVYLPGLFFPKATMQVKPKLVRVKRKRRF